MVKIFFSRVKFYVLACILHKHVTRLAGGEKLTASLYTMSNLKNHVSQRLDISKAPLRLLLELLSSLGLQLWSQGAAVDGWRGCGEPAVCCSCCRVSWTEAEGLMLLSHGLPGGSCQGEQISSW